MLSMFIVQHNQCEVFQLDQTEFNQAIKENKKLLEKSDINYLKNSTNAWVEPKKDHFFNNCSILEQFERLFIMLKYKKAFQNCEIEVLVDNARTHSTKIYDANQFNKFPGTNCIYEKIEWTENGVINGKQSKNFK